MSRLLGPDSSARLVYVPSSTFASAAGQPAIVYAAATGSTLANILTYDGTSTPGAPIAGSTVTVNADSQIPLFWYPDNEDTVYIEVNGGTRTEVPASMDMRVDRISGDVVAPLIGTGTVSGGRVTINGSNPQAFDVAPLVGYVVDYLTDPLNPTVVRLETTSPITTVLDAPAQLRLLTWILMDSTGAIVQQATRPTDSQRRTHLQVGTAAYDTGSGVIFSTQTLPVIVNQPMNQMYDLMYALGPFSITGNIISPDGANLTFNKTSGSIFAVSFSHFIAGVPTNNPHVSSTPAQTPVTFREITTSLTVVPPLTTTVDVANYDVGGVVTPIGGGANTSSIHRVFLSAANTLTGQVMLQYGQATYSSLAAAVNAVGSEPYTINSALDGTAALIGYIAAIRTATDLSNTSQATFIRASKFSNP